jgi:hypothetical protein
MHIEPLYASRRSIPLRLVLAVLWLTLAACTSQSSDTRTSAPQKSAPRAQLSIGYSLLYQEADGIPKLNWLLMFKNKTTQMRQVTDDLLAYYKQLADNMRKLSKEHRDLRIDAPATSEIEGKTREAIGKDLAKDLAPLIGRTGVDFEREALLTFYNGLNEQRHLVGVMVPLETDPVLRRFLETTKPQLDARYAKIGALLNRRYFTH